MKTSKIFLLGGSGKLGQQLIKTLKDVFVGTPGTEGSFSDIARSPVQQTAEQMGSIFTPGKEATSGFFGKGGEFFNLVKKVDLVYLILK